MVFSSKIFGLVRLKSAFSSLAVPFIPDVSSDLLSGAFDLFLPCYYLFLAP
jgi:hypothetical protein